MTFGILALRIWSLCRFWVPLCRICRICSLWGPWGSTVSFAALFLPIFMDSLGDVWHLGLRPHAFLRWRLASWLWGSGVLFLPIFMHSLGDVWHLGSEDLESLQVLGPSLQDLQDLQSLGPLGVHSLTCCTLSSYLYAFLRWRLASWLWGSGVSAASGSFSAGSGGSAVSGALGGPQSHLLHSFFLSLCIP